MDTKARIVIRNRHAVAKALEQGAHGELNGIPLLLHHGELTLQNKGDYTGNPDGWFCGALVDAAIQAAPHLVAVYDGIDRLEVAEYKPSPV